MILHFGDNSVPCSGLQAISILGYSFYSFFYSLQFRRKRYQRYQSESLLVIRISEWIRVALLSIPSQPKRRFVDALFQHPRLIRSTNGHTSAAWDLALLIDVSLRQVTG